MNKGRQHWAKDRRIKKHKEEQYNFLRITFAVLFVIFIFVSVHIVAFSRFLRIENIEIKGLETLEGDRVRQRLSEYLEGRNALIFPRNRFFFLQKKGVESFLMNEFRKIRSVSVRKVFPETVRIEVMERDLLFLWCVEDNECYKVDEGGTAYEKADLNSDDIKENDLIKIVDRSRKSVDVGSKILEPEYIEFALKIRERLWSELGIFVLERYETSSKIANEVIVTTLDGWKIYFDTRDSIDNVTGILKTFFKKEVEFPETVDLEYIDFRVKGKVFYKMRGESENAEESAKQSTENEVTDKQKVTSEEKAISSEKKPDEDVN